MLLNSNFSACAGQFTQRLEQRIGLRIEIHENQVEPFFDAHRNQAKFAGIEIFDTVEFGSYEQGSIEAVSPAMIAATEELPVSAARARVAGAVAANIMKASQNAVFATGNQQRLAEEVKGEIVSRTRRLMDMTDELPGGSEEFALFLLKCGGTEIEGCGQSGSTSDVAIGVNLKIRHRRSGRANSTAETPSAPRNIEKNRRQVKAKVLPFLALSRRPRRLGGRYIPFPQERLDRAFHSQGGTSKFCQLKSLKVSYLMATGVTAEVTIPWTALKTLRFYPEGQLTSVTWASGPRSAIVASELVIQPNSQTETRII